MKYVFIVNPNSGSGKSLMVSRKLENMCMEAGIDYDIHYTEKKMDAANIAKKYRECEDVTIFSIGGDGTLNEIIQSMPDAKCKLEVVPSGTGNDFYKTIEKIKEPDKKIDLGHVNKEFFINTMSIGIDAEISKNVEFIRMKKYVPTSQRYNASILYTLKNFKPYHIDVLVDSKPIITPEEDLWLLAICNGTAYGGGFKIAPNAQVDDGLLDVYLVKNIKKTDLIKIIPMLVKGRHEECEGVYHYKASKVRVKSDKELVCGLDGENIYDSDFKVTVEKETITLSNNKQLIKKLLEQSKKKS